MTPQTKLTALIATARIATGAALIAAPGRLGALWLGGDAARPGPRLALRALGARDVALGAGALATLGDATRLRRWVATAAICDLVDAASALATPSTALPAGARRATAAMGGGGALAGALAYRALDRDA